MRYYDPEYERIVEKSEVERQYNFFSSQPYFKKSFEEFARDNFFETKKYLVFSENGRFLYDTEDLEDARDTVAAYGGRIEDNEGNLVEGK